MPRLRLSDILEALMELKGEPAALAATELGPGAQGPPGDPGAKGDTGPQGPPGDPLSAIAAWPVGSVYICVTATSPAMLFGGGTWVAFAAGRVLVGQDSAQSEFDTLEEVGGAKAHTLALTEIPSHAHTVPVGATDDTAAPFDRADAGTNASGANATTLTGAAGSGAAHNNLQPYIVVRFWKRTA